MRQWVKNFARENKVNRETCVDDFRLSQKASIFLARKHVLAFSRISRMSRESCGAGYTLLISLVSPTFFRILVNLMISVQLALGTAQLTDDARKEKDENQTEHIFFLPCLIN